MVFFSVQEAPQPTVISFYSPVPSPEFVTAVYLLVSVCEFTDHNHMATMFLPTPLSVQYGNTGNEQTNEGVCVCVCQAQQIADPAWISR